MTRYLFTRFLALVIGLGGVAASTFPAWGAPPGGNIPKSFSSVPAQITFDFANSLGKFNKYLFTVVDAPYPLEEGYKLAKEANFQAIGMIHFSSQRKLAEEKARLLNKYGLEGIIYWELEAHKYLPEKELKQKIDHLLDLIAELAEKYPNFKIKTILFGNEPNLPQKIFWKGSAAEFCENYATFVRYVKSKNKDLIVGGPGFAGGEAGGSRSNWPETFMKYLHENNVPLDFIAFHSYATGVKDGFIDEINLYKKLLRQYPVKSPIFGTPKLANNEYDFIGHGVEERKYFKEMDTAWRGAHNILSLMAMVNEGIWLASELCGPFKADRDLDFLWVGKNGTIKPVYYAHKAFNSLADTIQIAQKGSNFETFGALAGKSADGKRLTIVLANYDEHGYRHFYPHTDKNPSRQSADAKVYGQYDFTIVNLPWTQKDSIKVERYLVDDQHNLSLVASSVMAGAQKLSLTGTSKTPEVQVIKLEKQ